MPAKCVLPWGKSLRFEALKVRIHPVKRSTSPARPRLPRVWKLPSSAVLEGGQRAAVEARIRVWAVEAQRASALVGDPSWRKSVPQVTLSQR